MTKLFVVTTLITRQKVAVNYIKTDINKKTQW